MLRTSQEVVYSCLWFFGAVYADRRINYICGIPVVVAGGGGGGGLKSHDCVLQCAFPFTLAEVWCFLFDEQLVKLCLV